MTYGYIFGCNVCKATKAESNKWLMVRVNRKSSVSTSGMDSFEIMHWNGEYSTHSDILHICGESCLQKELAKFLVRG